MSRSNSVLALALVLGALAALAGYAGLKATAQKVAQNTSKHFVPVVVTATDLTFGAKLDRAQLRVARYPKESVPAGAFSDPDSVVGQTTKIFLAAREPITATKLSSRGGGLSMLVRPGLRATSLEVNQVSGVSGFVLPGDRVDVLCTVDGRGADQEAQTKTILQNAEVLASGQKTTQQDNKPITVQAVTILVDPTGAERLALGLHEGKIHLVLRNPEDADTMRVAGLSTGEMLDGRPGPKLARAVNRSLKKTGAVVASAPTPRMPIARPVKPTVRIIREAKVTELPALRDSVR
ncbi:MAG TPA: Flp pilus assembly protein CpaB [Candidatus Eisenbacteria bacterium]|nr:Flp pilus assembly protein CpaB [Candidatus Eisenbacteria bacterium]